jgi:hypothetical protein
MRVKVSVTGLYTYPDVTVVCGEPQFEDAEVDTLLNPTVLVEVLSPSTADYDRGGKATHYRSLPSLQEYVLISQDRALVEHYARQGPDQWLLTERHSLDDTLVLNSIHCRLPLAEIYLKVRFPAADERRPSSSSSSCQASLLTRKSSRSRSSITRSTAARWIARSPIAAGSIPSARSNDSSESGPPTAQFQTAASVGSAMRLTPAATPRP